MCNRKGDEKMNGQDKIWLEKCKQQPEKYEISVDNDCISVCETNPYKEDTEKWYNFDGVVSKSVTTERSIALNA